MSGFMLGLAPGLIVAWWALRDANKKIIAATEMYRHANKEFADATRQHKETSALIDSYTNPVEHIDDWMDG